MRSIGLVFALLLVGCGADGLEGTYHADDGEGSRTAMTLKGGRIELVQGDLPPFSGTYEERDGQLVLSIGGRDIAVTAKDNCLYPVDEPNQPICKRR